MDVRCYYIAQSLVIAGFEISFSRLKSRIQVLERDAFRLNEKASLRDGGTIKIEGLGSLKSENGSIEDRLKELDDLRSKNLITEDEYKNARSQILEDI